jgi:pentatricopeptide repeat protein
MPESISRPASTRCIPQSQQSRSAIGGVPGRRRTPPAGSWCRGFLTGLDAEWIDEQRDALQLRLASALECVGEVRLAIGGHELASAERSARNLIRLEPYRESGYRLLMRTLAQRGNVADALRVYDDLRQLLARELGAAPSHSSRTCIASCSASLV